MHFHPSLSLTPPLYYILPLLPFFLPCHKVWFCYIHHWQILTGIFHLLFFISPFSYPFFLHLFFFPLMPLLLQLEDMRERCKLHMQRVRTKPDSQLGLRLSDLSSCEHYNRMSNRLRHYKLWRLLMRMCATVCHKTFATNSLSDCTENISILGVRWSRRVVTAYFRLRKYSNWLLTDKTLKIQYCRPVLRASECARGLISSPACQTTQHDHPMVTEMRQSMAAANVAVTHVCVENVEGYSYS